MKSISLPTSPVAVTDHPGHLSRVASLPPDNEKLEGVQVELHADRQNFVGLPASFRVIQAFGHRLNIYGCFVAHYNTQAKETDMAEDDLRHLLILRVLDRPVTRERFDQLIEVSGAVLRELQSEEVEILWIDSEVLTLPDGLVTGTFCHYLAESEDVVREHASRAGLPVTRIYYRGQPLKGESYSKAARLTRRY